MRRAIAGSHIIHFMLSALPLLTISPVCWAHDDPNATVPAVRALRVDTPLTVDGVLDEPFWQDAEVGGDFIDTRSGQAAAQQTQFRVAYTRTHLYIAVECFDDRIDEIHATEQREDRRFQGDDWVEVHLDPMHTHNSKYAFFSNPLGVRVDAAEGPSGAFSTSWSAEWEQAAHISEDRWAFEMSLPLAVLNYRQEDGQTWGINFTRYLVRSDVTSFWSYNVTDFYKPRYFGHLTSLDLADSKFDRNLEITPYITSHSEFNGENKTQLETGGDVSFRLTPSITSSWTVNPDFAQVEADADTIELRDTERFLPEKRLFFREGEELFNSNGDRLYYSRRFTDIDAGARVSGETDGFKFALIDVFGDTVNGESFYGNSSVVRLLRNVGEKSSVGLHMSSSDLKEGSSRVYANDATFYLNEDWRFSYQVAGADDRLEDESEQLDKDRRDYYGYSAVAYERYPWEFSLNYMAISEGFDPVLGYIQRQDIFGPRLFSSYNLRSSDRWYKSLYAYSSVAYFDDGDHDTSLRDYSADVGTVLSNDMELRAGYDDDYHRPYDNRRYSFDLVFDDSNYWKRMDFGYAFGVFEEVEYEELEFGRHLKPLENWPIRYEYVVRFEEDRDGDEDTIWLNRVVFDYFFTDLMWLKSAIQHRSTEVHNISVIYGWEFIKDAHFYLVYNGIREEDDTETGHSIFVKMAYTFR